ncbi:hypothetical protein ADIS_1376 [Lunatimonas lonarensis]|uniref:Uncharacterized protein n=1 Tax=Lunatimonas lonarensis TaxID=1232681 RepID=R7ZW09_9BACT|nr:hypothetical protein ADIS_1376 [Lunatimonas lonarensis]
MLWSTRCWANIFGKKISGIAPLQPPTLASFRTWGIQQELVVPLGTKVHILDITAI